MHIFHSENIFFIKEMMFIKEAPLMNFTLMANLIKTDLAIKPFSLRLEIH